MPTTKANANVVRKRAPCKHRMGGDPHWETARCDSGLCFYCTTSVTASCELLGDCGVCERQDVPISEFAPAKYTHTKKNVFFTRAVDEFCKAARCGDAVAMREAREVVDSTRKNGCMVCANESRRKALQLQAEEEAFDVARAIACGNQQGCYNSTCPHQHQLCQEMLLPIDECAVTEARDDPLQAAAFLDKLCTSDEHHVQLCKAQWARHRQSMETGSQGVLRWLCPCCYATSTCLFRDNTLPEVCVAKARYVTATKRCIGQCEGCGYDMAHEKELLFKFKHRHLDTKNFEVAELVMRTASATSLLNVRHLLDIEMAKCDLLCINCCVRAVRGLPRPQEKSWTRVPKRKRSTKCALRFD